MIFSAACPFSLDGGDKPFREKLIQRLDHCFRVGSIGVKNVYAVFIVVFHILVCGWLFRAVTETVGRDGRGQRGDLGKTVGMLFPTVVDLKGSLGEVFVEAVVKIVHYNSFVAGIAS